MILFVLLNIAHADDRYVEEKEPTVIYKKKTEIDFEGVEIEGQFKKPTGAMVSEHKSAIFNSLIQIREEWNQEMMNSVNQIE